MLTTWLPLRSSYPRANPPTSISSHKPGRLIRQKLPWRAFKILGYSRSAARLQAHGKGGRVAKSCGRIFSRTAVLFCDVVGSTPISTRLDPEELRGGIP